VIRHREQMLGRWQPALLKMCLIAETGDREPGGIERLDIRNSDKNKSPIG